jgi:hypothetical protein
MCDNLANSSRPETEKCQFKYCEENCNVAATSPHRFPFSLKKVQITETFYRTSTNISKEFKFSELTLCKSMFSCTAPKYKFSLN